jgi:hypothetical protein
MEHPTITLKNCKNIKLLPSFPEELWLKKLTVAYTHAHTHSLSLSLSLSLSFSLLPAVAMTYGSAVEKRMLVVWMKE